MGGKVLELESERIARVNREVGRREGIKEGREEGREEGQLATLLKFIIDGRITIKEAAEEYSLNEHDLQVAVDQKLRG